MHTIAQCTIFQYLYCRFMYTANLRSNIYIQTACKKGTVQVFVFLQLHSETYCTVPWGRLGGKYLISLPHHFKFFISILNTHNTKFLETAWTLTNLGTQEPRENRRKNRKPSQNKFFQNKTKILYLQCIKLKNIKINHFWRFSRKFVPLRRKFE